MVTHRKMQSTKLTFYFDLKCYLFIQKLIETATTTKEK